MKSTRTTIFPVIVVLSVMPNSHGRQNLNLKYSYNLDFNSKYFTVLNQHPQSVKQICGRKFNFYLSEMIKFLFARRYEIVLTTTILS